MAYEVKDFGALVGTEGFSESLLKNHFTLYMGYVNNTNKLMDAFAAMQKDGKTQDQLKLKEFQWSTERSAVLSDPQYAELKRRFGWEFNGMRLHEYYFGNIRKGGSKLEMNSELAKKITADFGSVPNWESEFRAIGAMRGIGWVILYYDYCGDRMFNVWINEHDGGHPAGAIPLLVMDVFEHAFLTDYGLKKADYIAAFFKAIHWERVRARFEECKTPVCVECL